MSIYNRKMFKRNARNALNSSAGISSVQKFTGGGTVAGYKSFTAPRVGSPFRFATRPDFFGGRSGLPSLARRYAQDPSSLSPLQRAEVLAGQDKFNIYNRMRDIPGDTRVGNLLSSGLRRAAADFGGAASLGQRVMGNVAGPAIKFALGSPEGPSQDTLGGRVSSMQQVNPELSGEYLSSLGIVPPGGPLDPANLQGASRGRGFSRPPIPEGGMAAQRIRDEIQAGETATDNSPEAIARRQAEAEARKQMETLGMAFSDEETGKIPSRDAERYMAGLIVDDIEEYKRSVDAADRDEADVDLAEYKKEEDKSGDGASGGGGQEGGDAAPSAKEEIERVITEGTPEEQQSELEQLMAEFTENAPEYKGMNQGLALAKIGFAMAAGKSENAIENIANALEQGADMLIKDQSKKDEFNRQVKLSALQYGLKDISATRQLQRAAEFQTSDYVLMPGESYTYPDGRTVTGGEGGTTISLRKSDVLKNGLPDGVMGTSMATALVNKQAKFEAAIKAAEANGIKSRTLDTPKKITEYVDDYGKSVTDVINSNNAMHLTKQVMVLNAQGKITGFQPGFNSMLAKAMTLAGVDATKYTDRDLAIADLRKVFQKLVPLTLGKDQSANSISDKDVNRLADAYMSDAVLSGGVLGLMTTPSNVLDSKLNGVLVEFENAQKSALDKLNSLEQTGAEFLTPSGAALGTRVAAQRKRLQPFLPQGSRSMLSIGDDGIYRLV